MRSKKKKNVGKRETWVRTTTPTSVETEKPKNRENFGGEDLRDKPKECALEKHRGNLRKPWGGNFDNRKGLAEL